MQKVDLFLNFNFKHKKMSAISYFIVVCIQIIA